MSQTAHTQDPAVALEGMEADTSLAKERISGLATVAIPFGHFVSAEGSAENPYAVELPDATAKVTDGRGLGVAVSDVSVESDGGAGNGYEIDDAVPILRRGRVWVISEDAVAAVGTPAFVRFAAGGGGSVLGAFRTDADTASAVGLPGARFMTTSAGAGELVVLELTGNG
jgi:hypothetical protein